MKLRYFLLLISLYTSFHLYGQNNKDFVALYKNLIETLEKINNAIDRFPKKEEPEKKEPAPPEIEPIQQLKNEQIAALSNEAKIKSDRALLDALQQLQIEAPVKDVKNIFIQNLSGAKDFKYRQGQSIENLADQIITSIETSIAPGPAMTPAQYLEIEADPIINKVIDQLNPFILGDKKSFIEKTKTPLTLTILPRILKTGAELSKYYEKEKPRVPEEIVPAVPEEPVGPEEVVPPPPAPVPGAVPPPPPPPAPAPPPPGVPAESKPLSQDEIAALPLEEKDESNRLFSKVLTAIANTPIFKKEELKTPDAFITGITDKITNLKKQMNFKYQEATRPDKLAQAIKSMLMNLMPKSGQDIKTYLIAQSTNFDDTIDTLVDIIGPTVLGDNTKKKAFLEKARPLLRRILLKLLILIRSENLKIPEPYSTEQMQQSDNLFLEALEVTNKKTAADISKRIAQNVEMLVINPDYLKFKTIIDQRFKKEVAVAEETKVKPGVVKPEIKPEEIAAAMERLKKKREEAVEPKEKPAEPAPPKIELTQEDSLFNVLTKPVGTYAPDAITPSFISNYVFDVGTLLPKIKETLRFPLTGAKKIPIKKERREIKSLDAMLISLERGIDLLSFLQALIDVKLQSNILMTWHSYTTPVDPETQAAFKKLNPEQQNEIKPFTDIKELKTSLDLQRQLFIWWQQKNTDLITAQMDYLLKMERITSQVTLSENQIKALEEISDKRKDLGLDPFERSVDVAISIKNPNDLMQTWINLLVEKNVIDPDFAQKLRERRFDEQAERLYYVVKNIDLYKEKVQKKRARIIVE